MKVAGGVHYRVPALMAAIETDHHRMGELAGKVVCKNALPFIAETHS